MKKEKGSITIEASLALTFFMFFILTFISLGVQFKIQSAVKHAVNQSAQTLSISNKWQEVIAGMSVPELVNSVGELITEIDPDLGAQWVEFTSDMQSFENYSEAELQKELKKYIVYYLTGVETDDESTMNSELNKLQILEMDLDGTKIDGGNIEIKVKYKVYSKISFWADELTFNESLTLKLFS